MKKFLICLLIFLLGFAAHGFLSYLGFYGTWAFHDREMRSVTSYLPADELNLIANDPARPPSQRAAAVFSLFAHHLSSGMERDELKAVMGNPLWLEESVVGVVDVLAGSLPLNSSFAEEEIVAITLFHGTPDTGTIYLVLKGDGDRDDVLRFLGGKEGPSEFSRLGEFALCFPHPFHKGIGRTERFTKWQISCKQR